jgi:hypothetical protein
MNDNYNMRQRGFILTDDMKLKPFSIKKLTDGNEWDNKDIGLSEGHIKIISAFVGVKDREVKILYDASIYHVELSSEGLTVLPYIEIQSGKLSWDIYKILLQKLFNKKSQVNFTFERAKSSPPLMRVMSWKEINNILPKSNQLGATSSLKSSLDGINNIFGSMCTDMNEGVNKFNIKKNEKQKEEEEYGRIMRDAIKTASLFQRELLSGHQLTESEFKHLNMVKEYIDNGTINEKLMDNNNMNP